MHTINDWSRARRERMVRWKRRHTRSPFPSSSAPPHLHHQRITSQQSPHLGLQHSISPSNLRRPLVQAGRQAGRQAGSKPIDCVPGWMANGSHRADSQSRIDQYSPRVCWWYSRPLLTVLLLAAGSVLTIAVAICCNCCCCFFFLLRSFPFFLFLLRPSHANGPTCTANYLHTNLPLN